MRRFTVLCESVATANKATLAHEGPNGLKIWYYERPGNASPFAIIQRTGKAVTLKRGDHVKFRSHSYRDQWAKEQIESATSRAERVRARQIEDANHRTSLVVGSIIYASWGWEQTNVEFAEVVSVNPSGKTVMVRDISKRIEESGFMSGNAFPIPGRFTSEPKVFRPRRYDSGRMGDHHYSPWSGGPIYCSWYA